MPTPTALYSVRNELSKSFGPRDVLVRRALAQLHRAARECISSRAILALGFRSSAHSHRRSGRTGAEPVEGNRGFSTDRADPGKRRVPRAPGTGLLDDLAARGGPRA